MPTQHGSFSDSIQLFCMTPLDPTSCLTHSSVYESSVRLVKNPNQAEVVRPHAVLGSSQLSGAEGSAHMMYCTVD